MWNPIEAIRQRREEKKAELEEQLHEAQHALQELQSQKRSGISQLFHPVQSVKDTREIKNLDNKIHSLEHSIRSFEKDRNAGMIIAQIYFYWPKHAKDV